MKFYRFTLIVLFLYAPSLLAKGIWVDLIELAPTQMNIGMLAMKDKIEKIEEKYNDGDLLSYLRKKSAPAYLGPDGRYHIIDRHHTSRALAEASVPFKKFFVEIEKDLSHLSRNEFYQFMELNNYLYLYDRGTLKTAADLPKTLWELSDDPYRSLAWLVREEGGFDKEEIPYLEFMWGNFFRQRINLANSSEEELRRALPKAMVLSQSDEASHLPGYNVEVISDSNRTHTVR